ncbi:hypothetical protein M9Y10_014770 [Tritrichomonas musculus]|uniref:EF-hand domain-containing protein n=1 Tax=Tritrichomonas musculus TaxID=1915356 RepID=A0ABR2L0F9_9EUKA
MSSYRVYTCNKGEEEVMAIYANLDQNENGLLDENELKVLCRMLEMPEQYSLLCILLVGRGKSEINFNQFKKFLEILGLYRINKTEFYNMVFESLDQDDSGTLDLDEVLLFLRLLGLNLTPGQVVSIISQHGINPDIHLNKQEFSYLVDGIESGLKS